MSLEQRISKGIMEAMKAKDTVRLSALRNAKKYIIEAKTSGPEIAELPDADVLKIVSKLAKQGTDSAAIFTEQNRPDLAQEELAQVSAPAAHVRGADGRGTGAYRRDGSLVAQGDGQGDGAGFETPRGPCRRQGHFGQGPRAAGLIRGCPQGFAATADVPGRRIAGPVFRRRAVVRHPSGKRPCRIRNAANEIDICTYSNRCTAM